MELRGSCMGLQRAGETELGEAHIRVELKQTGTGETKTLRVGEGYTLY